MDETLRELGRRNSSVASVEELQKSPRMFMMRHQGWTGVGATQKLDGLARAGLQVRKFACTKHELSDSSGDELGIDASLLELPMDDEVLPGDAAGAAPD